MIFIGKNLPIYSILLLLFFKLDCLESSHQENTNTHTLIFKSLKMIKSETSELIQRYDMVPKKHKRIKQIKVNTLRLFLEYCEQHMRVMELIKQTNTPPEPSSIYISFINNWEQVRKQCEKQIQKL